jgi:hypothetical protein
MHKIHAMYVHDIVLDQYLFILFISIRPAIHVTSHTSKIEHSTTYSAQLLKISTQYSATQKQY